MERWWSDTEWGNRSTDNKTSPSVTLSTANPKWTDPVSNPGLRGEKSVTKCLSHGMGLNKFNFQDRSLMRYDALHIFMQNRVTNF